MGHKSSKIELENRNIRGSLINSKMFYRNRLYIINEHTQDIFKFTHIYGINGEQWYNNNMKKSDILFFDNNYCIKYKHLNIDACIYLKKSSYKKLKRFINRFPDSYINNIF